MPIGYATYSLRGGYIENWLVAGPQAIPVPELERFGEDKLQIARHYYEEAPGTGDPPVEQGTFTLAGEKLTWEYYRCRDDHFVDWTAFYHTCHYLRAWAYARVVSPAAQEVTVIVTTNGPADVWLNNSHVHRQEHFHHQIPRSVSFRARLAQGHNELLVRCEEVAMRECPFALAVELVGLVGEGAAVALPTDGEKLERRQALERAFEAAYLERDVYVWDEEIAVHWPPESGDSPGLAVRLQTPAGWIYGENLSAGSAAKPARMSRAYEVPEGRYLAVLMPRPQEYYVENVRIQRRIGLWAVRNRYAQDPYGTYQERRAEALLDAAHREANVYSEIAKMALGYWADVKTDAIMAAIEGINRRQDCSDFYLVGLLGMMHRYGSDPSFPEALRQPLEACVLNFKYWMDEPTSDAMCYWSENHQILFHACEILAGQLYPDRVFTNTGQTGRWHREKGERLATAWLLKRGRGGFREWDSNCYFEEDLVALSHLADLADDRQVYELASVVADKMLFTMAINSYRGVFGSTHGRTYTPFIKSGHLEPTAGIGRLLWGMGAFNSHVLGTVSLACAQNYELPAIIEAIARDLPEEMWDRERHAGELEPACDRAEGRWEVNKVTYKTPDYMLSSAQDYRPGQPGSQEHIWQATLGPSAAVFVTHPPCTSEEGSHRPSFWHGNAILPRVAQWKDVLIAVHLLPEGDWLGFTHAYFPMRAFDACDLRQGWAFARQGDGYLALTAARGLELVTRGDSAYRELRSYGSPNVWLCLLGRAAQDESFHSFQERVLGLKLQFAGPSVQLITQRGEQLSFGWEGPLLVDGREEPITGFKHYENPYCTADLPAEQMDIAYGDQVMRLHFGAE